MEEAGCRQGNMKLEILKLLIISSFISPKKNSREFQHHLLYLNSREYKLEMRFLLAHAGVPMVTHASSEVQINPTIYTH